ncbi:MAG: glycosyltransferase family 1 protein, partial [Cyanobacteria bacterium P01_D01_bin.56]
KSYRIMTIYDVSFKLYPKYATAVSKNYFSQIKRSLAWTDLIITISESSKKDIVDCFNVAESDVWVTPLASRYAYINDRSGQSDSILEPAVSAMSHRSVNYNREQPYILFVGTLEPRKNIISIIQAFEHLKATKKIPHKLFLVGRKGWFYEPILEAIRQSPYLEDIHHLDYVSDESMVNLYEGATLFVYPSHYEGFGLPVLEAMSLGCPVITSNTSSLPEVVGNAAIMVCPEDLEELTNALYKVIDSASLRQRMTQAGYSQAVKFSWKRTAQTTIAAYRHLLL